MKFIIIITSILLLASCGESNEEKELRKANDLIESQKRKLRDDSILMEERLRIDEALIRAGKPPKYFIDTSDLFK